MQTPDGLGDEPIFSDSRTKLERAKMLIKEFRDAELAYASSKPLTVRWDVSEGRRDIVGQWKGVGKLPAAILGDAAHNIRSPLDLMAVELMALMGKSGEKSYFPFANSKAEFPAAISRSGLNKLGDEFVNHLHALAPYKGGKDQLHALHDLDLIDKHRHLVPHTSSYNTIITGSYSLDGSDPDTLDIALKECSFVFAEESFFHGRNIAQTLDELCELVNQILNDFSRLVRP
jgi:hypothetical protein